jgi:hypothetical protein
VDLKDYKNQKQIKLSEEKLEFRTLDRIKRLYAINIVSPARFFKIDKKDLKSQIVFTDTAKTAFYDALHFVNDKLAYTFSDADKDKLLKLAVYKDGKWSMFKSDFKLNEGKLLLQPAIPIFPPLRNIYGLPQVEKLQEL